jgi:taurine dioxygenase
MTSYVLQPVGTTFGAKVVGLDLSQPVDAATAERLRADLAEHRVLVLSGLDLDHATHVAFSRQFGPLDVYPVHKYLVPGFPELLTISNIFQNGKPIGLYDGDDMVEWHTDYSWRTVMSRASLLYASVAEGDGGDTLFADSTAAYDELPDELKLRIDGLKAVHSMAYLVEQELLTNPHKTPLTAQERAAMPDVAHPLVRHHPITGRRSLLLGSMIVSGIVGLDEIESAKLLGELLDHTTADRYVYRHRWTAGDLVIWDNTATMHTRTPCDRTKVQRLLYRTTVL